MMFLRLSLAAALALTTACVLVDADDNSSTTHNHGDHGSLRAVASISAKSGSTLSGHAIFSEVDGGVVIELSVEDAPPGPHAVHIHDVGDCSSDDGKSAGGHFNPDGHDHGAPHALVHHAGDLGNMWVNDEGEGHHVILMPELTVAEGPHSVVGRAIIVHAKADDLVSQPTGAAGARIGCGEIR